MQTHELSTSPVQPTAPISFQRPGQLLNSCFEEILKADLGSKPRKKSPGRFGTFLSAYFIFSNLDSKPFVATVDFLKGRFERTLAGRKMEVYSKAVAVSFKLEAGCHMKYYLIKQLLNRSYFESGGCWRETTEKSEQDMDREFEFSKGGATSILGYYDLATRVLTVWDSAECIVYLEGDHLNATSVRSFSTSVPPAPSVGPASEPAQGLPPSVPPVEPEIELENLEEPFLGGNWIE